MDARPGGIMAKGVYTNSELDAVEESSVEAAIEAKAIGQKIRRLRLKRSMGLVELGQRTSLSASFLSQIETARVVPTLRNLARIALVFGKDFSYFFGDESEHPFHLSRAASRIRLPVEKKETVFLLSDSLSALIPDRSVIPCIADFLPTVEGATFDPYIFEGLEFVYVIEGSVTLSTKTEKQVLHAGDNAWIDGSATRQYQRYGDKPARAMIITFPTRS
jgi:transcriptional regulator with XRE-family HTH domain